MSSKLLAFIMCSGALMVGVSAHADGPYTCKPSHFDSSVNWVTDGMQSAQLSPKHRYTVAHGGKSDEFVIGVCDPANRADIQYFIFKEGSSDGNLCSLQGVQVNIVPYGKKVEKPCKTEDAICRRLKKYTANQRASIRKYGLDVIQVDDQRCDAYWVFIDPSTHRLTLTHPN